jgi:NAD(P)-dependent dehydrogenase (short-subunit alcohol dehydrogenase family)
VVRPGRVRRLSKNYGRVALVSAGSRGIGAATVRRLAADGWNVSFCHDHDEQAAVEAEKAALELGARALAVQADVTEAAQVASWVRRAEESLGPVQAVVSCAGISRDRPLSHLQHADWRAVTDTSLDGLFHLCRAALPAMMQRGSGRIIAVSSLSGVYGPATGNPATGHPVTGNPASGNPGTQDPSVGNPSTTSHVVGGRAVGGRAAGGPAGEGAAAGHRTAGNSPAGNSPAGNSPAGNSAVGNNAVGNWAAGNWAPGNWAAGNRTAACGPAADRAGLAGFTRALASQTARYGIRVNALVPASVSGEETAIWPEGTPALLTEVIALRRFASAAAAADRVAFLLSDAAADLTGAVLEVPGGIEALAASDLGHTPQTWPSARLRGTRGTSGLRQPTFSFGLVADRLPGSCAAHGVRVPLAP